MSKPRRARWYLTHFGSCPKCGRDKTYRVARYTKPPAKMKRYTPIPASLCYDWCDE